MLERSEVDHVANLARLALTDEELERMRLELASVLGHIQTLGELDTERIPPSASVLPLSNVMAEDEPRPSLDTRAVLANAPAHEDGQFRVPPIFEEA